MNNFFFFFFCFLLIIALEENTTATKNSVLKKDHFLNTSIFSKQKRVTKYHLLCILAYCIFLCNCIFCVIYPHLIKPLKVLNNNILFLK